MELIPIENKDLREIQKIELQILKKIREICDKNNITYFLIGGTLLGAVRHEGFIPWDDDLDIAMFREDYERFIKIAQKELKAPFCITSLFNSEHKMLFSKVFKTDTIYCEGGEGESLFKQGLWVDIFPIDLIKKNNIEEAKKHAQKRQLIFHILIYISQHRKNKKKLANLKYELLNKCMMFMSCEKIDKLALNILSKDKIEQSKYCTNYGSQYGIEKQTMLVDFYLPVNKIKFEDELFNAPNNTHAILKNIYGDYMKLPPIEKRQGQHNLYIKRNT